MISWRSANDRDRPALSWLGDIALAVALAGFGAGDAMLTDGWPDPRAAVAGVMAASALCLVWRRRRPLLSFTGVIGGLTLIALAFGHFESGSSIIIAGVAVYSVAAYGTNVAFALAAIGAFAAALNLGQPRDEAIGDTVFTVGFMGIVFAAGLAVKTRNAQTRALQARTETLEHEQQQRAAAAAAEERRRIARELHDIIAHALGIVVLHVGVVEQLLESDPPRARAALALIRSTGQEAIGEMSTLVGLMRGAPEAALEPQPSLADLDRLIAQTTAAGLPAELTSDGEPRTLSPALELAVFRVAQEGLTNALKHADAATAHVVLRYREREVEIEVTDDGCGGSQGQGARTGLVGLRERVAVFGGRLQAEPGQGGGWCLRAAFPLTR